MSTTPSIHIGCLGFRGPQARYFAELDALELAAGQTVRGATLGRWRREAPDNARFIVPVDPGLVAAGFTGPEAEEAWGKTRTRAERLGADLVLLRTPSSFRPTAENRAALQAFLSGRTEGLTVVWRAEGLWEGQPDVRAAVCAASGLVPAVDPLALDDDEVPPEGPLFYWRVMGRLGLGGRCTDYDLERLVQFAEGRTGVIIFTAPTMRPDALRLIAHLRALADAG